MSCYRCKLNPEEKWFFKGPVAAILLVSIAVKNWSVIFMEMDLIQKCKDSYSYLSGKHRRIWDPVLHLPWSFFVKKKTAFSRSIFLQKSSITDVGQDLKYTSEIRPFQQKLLTKICWKFVDFLQHIS